MRAHRGSSATAEGIGCGGLVGIEVIFLLASIWCSKDDAATSRRTHSDPCFQIRTREEVRTRPCGPRSSVQDGYGWVCGGARSDRSDQPELGERRYAIIEADLLGDAAVDHLQHAGAGEVH